MARVTWAAIAAVAIAGIVTGWYSVQLQQYTLEGLPPRELNAGLLALSGLPTGLLWGASVLRRRSATMQVNVIVVAVVVGLVRVSVIRSELSTPWGHGTGLWSGLAWGAGVVAAGTLLLAAGVAVIGDRAGRRRAAPTDAESGEGIPNG